MQEYIINAENLNKTYAGTNIDPGVSGLMLWVKNIFRLTANKSITTQALKNVSFHIKKGETVGIFGANGAGKTSLIKILSGLLYPSTGQLSVNGHTSIRKIKNNISYISTNGWMGLEWQLTAKENLIYYGNLFGMSGKDLDKRCDKLLDQLDMCENGNKYISQLSAGMRQKITIARGLLLDREILYLDEPSVSLDVNAAAKIRQMVQKYAVENNKTILISSHVPEDLANAQRIMFLYKGEIIALGTLKELGKPFSDIETISIKCQEIEDSVLQGLDKLNGVMSLSVKAIDGNKQFNEVKINIYKNMISAGDVIDKFIENDINILSLKNQEPSLQEIYEYYIRRRNG
ncbi:MAG: ABC transporter ATP-binding protein [Clostridiales bacterium]|nr:ABC transporter ATP-binding protein [Clostridiales bacterium]